MTIAREATRYGGVAIPTLDKYQIKLHDLLDSFAHFTNTEAISTGKNYLSLINSQAKNLDLSQNDKAKAIYDAIIAREKLYDIKDGHGLKYGSKFPAKPEEYKEYQSVYDQYIMQAVELVNQSRIERSLDSRNYITSGGTLPNKAITTAKARSQENMALNIMLSVGDDEAGRTIVKDMQQNNVNATISKTMRLIATKESIHFTEDRYGNPTDKLTIKGPAEKTQDYNPEEFIKEALSFFDKNRIELMMIEGGMASDNKYGLNTALTLSKYAKDNNLRVISSPFTDRQSQLRPEINDYEIYNFNLSESSFMNGNEFVSLMLPKDSDHTQDYEKKDDPTLHKAIERCQNLLRTEHTGNTNIVEPFTIVTLGMEGMYFINKNSASHIAIPEELKIEDNDIIDKVGAGDTTQAFQLILRNVLISQAQQQNNLPLKLNDEQRKQIKIAGMVGGGLVIQQIGPQLPKDVIIQATEGILNNLKEATNETKKPCNTAGIETITNVADTNKNISTRSTT